MRRRPRVATIAALTLALAAMTAPVATAAPVAIAVVPTTSAGFPRGAPPASHDATSTPHPSIASQRIARPSVDAFGRRMPRPAALPIAQRASGADVAAPNAAPTPAAPARTHGVHDGAGGLYVLFTEPTFSAGFFSQPSTAGQNFPLGASRLIRFASDGTPAPGWPAEGLPLAVAADNQGLAVFTSDSAGGVIVAWEDFTSFDVTLRVQRFDSTGARLWGSSGVDLYLGTGFRYVDDIAPDGAGGALVSWTDSGIDLLDDIEDIFVTRVTSAGAIAPGWPANGLRVCGATGIQYGSQVVPDPSGGLMVTWVDLRPASFGGTYAQRVSSAGAPQWMADGIPLSSPGLTDLVVASDGAGGVIVAFTSLGASSSADIFAQRFDSNGSPLWTPSGVVVCGDAAQQNWPRMAPDGAGGAFVQWYDYRDPDTFPDLYAQRVTGTGAIAPGWPSDGILVGDTIAAIPDAGILPDGAGGAYPVWSTSELAPIVIGPGDTLWMERMRFHAQRLTAAGPPAPGWPAGGVDLSGPDSRALGFDGGLAISADPAGGLACEWPDVRDRVNALYAQRVAPDGAVAWDPSGVRTVSYDAPDGLQIQPALAARAGGGVHAAWLQYGGGLNTVVLRSFDGTGAPAAPAAPLSSTSAYLASPAVADGFGGAFLCWLDLSSGVYATRVQRIDASGAALWTAGGVVAPDVPADGGGSRVLGMVADGAGGVIVACSDASAGGIRLQHIDAAGVPVWGGDSLYVNGQGQLNGLATMVSDGAGGVILAWETYVEDSGTMSYYTNLTAQRVRATGETAWGPQGVLIAPGPREQLFPRAIADGAGGMIVCWMGDQVFLNTDIWALRVDSTGAVSPGWPAAGVQVCSASGRQVLPDIAAAPFGGAFVAWWDGRGSTPRGYAQWLDGAGVPRWTADGVPIASGAGPQYLQTISADSTGGLQACWLDGGGSSWDVRAQRLDLNGDPQWGAGGVGVCTDPAHQFGPVLLTELPSAAVFGWIDARNGPALEVRVQRVNSAGALDWTPDGVTETLASLESIAAEPDVVRIAWRAGASVASAALERADSPGAWREIARIDADGAGRLAYEDRDVTAGARHGYRLRIAAPGGGATTAGEAWIDVPAAARFAFDGARPNPVAGDLVVSFALPARGVATLDVLDVSGRRVARREIAASAGRNVVNLGRLRAAPGVYLMKLAFGRETAVREVVVTR
jgi:hypothetical protein